MTDAFTDPAAQPPMQARSEQSFDRLNPSFAADHAARADDPAGLRTVEAGLVRGWAVTLSEHLENTGPSQWRQQHVADRASYAAERAARAERQVLSDAESAFARLNPDFGGAARRPPRRSARLCPTARGRPGPWHPCRSGRRGRSPPRPRTT